ncbi:hypothetical protein NLJ89_g4533 [Agrocybe chaxingu]|uniref:F-box domain-containing protein n=1 Tax=Agrocybe chaxingu TaxID=84603 RepID=A0A9W8MWF6_9AGAR|nr:hypothetical protein NLJ89_g4533 [Agrocybe chaxingu]
MLLPSTADDTIFDNIGPGDLIRYSRTCREAREAVAAYSRRAFHLEGVLSCYFTPTQILKFRELQFETGALISGSTALQLLDRTKYETSDLDVYVAQRGCKPIAFWLQSIGYKYVPRLPRFPYTQIVPELQTLDTALDYMRPHMPQILAIDRERDDEHQFLDPRDNGYSGGLNIYDFKKPNDEVKIQLITTWQAPLECVLNFHSTCVMNFITYDKAISLYPQATFDQRRALACHPNWQGRREAYAKYRSRGWKIIKNAWRLEAEDPESPFALGIRRVGDSKCWTVPICPKLEFPESTMEANTWYLERHWDTRGPEMAFSVFKSPILASRYLVANFEIEGVISGRPPETSTEGYSPTNFELLDPSDDY